MEVLNDTKTIFTKFMTYFGVLLIAGLVYMSTGTAFYAYASGQMPAVHAALIQNNLAQFVSALLAVTIGLATVLTGVETVIRVIMEPRAEKTQETPPQAAPEPAVVAE